MVAPTIATTTLPEATLGEPYQAAIEVAGGEEPLTFMLSSVPEGLSWLSIDAGSGALSGTPVDPGQPEVSITVRVEDRLARSDEKTLTLRIRSCTEGEQLDCFYAAGDACMLSTTICTNGAPAVCAGGNPSASLSYCGATCHDICSSANGSAVCEGGRCKTNCTAGFADCDGDFANGCEAGLNTPSSCGACGNVCGTAHTSSVTCSGGTTCQLFCQVGWANCNGVAADGCETPTASCGCLTVAGFQIQGIANGTYWRLGTSNAWENALNTIEYGAISAGTWEFLNKAQAPGRPALCIGALDTGPAACTPWREWRGSSLGFVTVPAILTCSQ